MLRFAALAFLALSLGACTHPIDNGDRAVRDTSGMAASSRAAQTPRETCLASCTRDYNVCMDEASNSRETMPGMGRLPSAGHSCDNDLRACHKRCAAL